MQIKNLVLYSENFLSQNHRKVYMQVIVTLVIIADDLVEITFQKLWNIYWSTIHACCIVRQAGWDRSQTLSLSYIYYQLLHTICGFH